MAYLVKPTKADYIQAINKARAKQKMYLENRIHVNTMVYKCSICKDKEFIWNQDVKAMVPCKCRVIRNMERRLKKSGLSVEEYRKKCIENFPIDREEACKMKELAMDFIANHKKGESIIYTGKSGTMKTSICMAICLDLTVKKAEDHLYFSYRDEMPILRWQMFNKVDAYQERIRTLINIDNLFIDDLFKTKKSVQDKEIKLDVSTTDLQIMFQIINGRYMNKKTTIFSSEYSLGQIIKDVDEATGTRILEMCGKYGMNCSDINRRLIR